MHSRSLGISAPIGENVYEILVTTKSRPGILGNLSTFLGQNGVDILGAHVQVSDDRTIGHTLLYVELKSTKTNIDELLYALREKEFVIDAKAESRNEMFFENMMFPLTARGHYKVFAIGANEWASLLDSFHRAFGSAASVILHQEGFSVGKSMIRNISTRFPKSPDSQTLLANLIGLFKATGLGILSMVGGKEEIGVKIEQTPVPCRRDFIDNFIVGIVTGAISEAYLSNYNVNGLICNGESMSFRLTREKKHKEKILRSDRERI
jgi:predicted amino acid-binding ACT domain protein